MPTVRKFWLYPTSLSIFIFIIILIGPEHRTALDYECDTTFTRAFQGAPAALFFSDWSSVPEVSLVYGGWPPFHTLIQAFFVLLGMSIPGARLAAGGPQPICICGCYGAAS